MPASMSPGTSGSTKPQECRMIGSPRAWPKSKVFLWAGQTMSLYIAGDMKGLSLKPMSS